VLKNLEKTLLTRNLRFSLDAMILFCLLQERVIEVSGGFLYFVRSRARKVVTTLVLEGAQDTSPRKVTS